MSKRSVWDVSTTRTMLMTIRREIAGEYGSKPLYRNLGYFSLICLLRVHVLLGDPTCEKSSSLQGSQG